MKFRVLPPSTLAEGKKRLLPLDPIVHSISADAIFFFENQINLQSDLS